MSSCCLTLSSLSLYVPSRYLSFLFLGSAIVVRCDVRKFIEFCRNNYFIFIILLDDLNLDCADLGVFWE